MRSAQTRSRVTEGRDIERFIKEFESWIPGPEARRKELRAELEDHLLAAREAGNLSESLSGLGSPREAAIAFGSTPNVAVASLFTRAAAFSVDTFLAGGGSFFLLGFITGAVWGGQGVPLPNSRTLSLVTLAGVFFASFALMEWQWGVTPGKKLARIRVVTPQGIRIALRQALIRRLPFVATGPFQLIDWVFVFFPPLHQRAFDRVAGTLVIDERKTWLPPSDQEQSRFGQVRYVAIFSGWASIGVFLAAFAYAVVWRNGLPTLVAAYVCALPGYVSIRTGLRIRPRDKYLIAAMVAGALGILPLIASFILPFIAGFFMGTWVLPGTVASGCRETTVWPTVGWYAILTGR